MVYYGSTWLTAQIFCQRCHKQKKGLSLKSVKMSAAGLSFDICSTCISEIAYESKEFTD